MIIILFKKLVNGIKVADVFLHAASSFTGDKVAKEGEISKNNDTKVDSIEQINTKKSEIGK